jgi:hypothetical protein
VVRSGVVVFWWARLMVESMLTAQVNSSAASASASSGAKILCQVPPRENRACRFHTVCHGANRSGTSSPRAPGPEPEDDALDHLPVILERPAKAP